MINMCTIAQDSGVGSASAKSVAVRSSLSAGSSAALAGAGGSNDFQNAENPARTDCSALPTA